MTSALLKTQLENTGDSIGKINLASQTKREKSSSSQKMLKDAWWQVIWWVVVLPTSLQAPELLSSSTKFLYSRPGPRQQLQ